MLDTKAIPFKWDLPRLPMIDTRPLTCSLSLRCVCGITLRARLYSWANTYNRNLMHVHAVGGLVPGPTGHRKWLAANKIIIKRLVDN